MGLFKDPYYQIKMKFYPLYRDKYGFGMLM